jgi:mxaJ protein
MCSRFLSLLLIAGCCTGADPRTLRVCADPNNLPFSNEAQQGFENRLADLIARELTRRLNTHGGLNESRSFEIHLTLADATF